jgi:hypothetical protein
MPPGKSKSDHVLKGWDKIAEFLGQTVSVAQRWQKSGMPIERKGRSVFAYPEELTRWVGRNRIRVNPFILPAKARIWLRISSRAYPMSANRKRLGSPESGSMQ